LTISSALVTCTFISKNATNAAVPGERLERPKIDPVNFHTFQEACAISTSITLSTFAQEGSSFQPGNAYDTCDCWIYDDANLPDAGIFGSDDIVAVDQAVLDVTARTPLIEENVPTCMEVHTRQGHPFRWLHGPHKDPYKVTEYGEKLGLGSREYELVDVYPVEQFSRGPMNSYISAR
jgi:hypothetical protein